MLHGTMIILKVNLECEFTNYLRESCGFGTCQSFSLKYFHEDASIKKI